MMTTEEKTHLNKKNVSGVMRERLSAMLILMLGILLLALGASGVSAQVGGGGPAPSTLIDWWGSSVTEAETSGDRWATSVPSYFGTIYGVGQTVAALIAIGVGAVGVIMGAYAAFEGSTQWAYVLSAAGILGSVTVFGIWWTITKGHLILYLILLVVIGVIVWQVEAIDSEVGVPLYLVFAFLILLYILVMPKSASAWNILQWEWAWGDTYGSWSEWYADIFGDLHRSAWAGSTFEEPYQGPDFGSEDHYEEIDEGVYGASVSGTVRLAVRCLFG